MWYQDRARGVIVTVLMFGGAAAIVSSVLSSQDYTATFLDCSKAVLEGGSWKGCNATSVLLPGSRSGFWSLWAMDARAVARSALFWE
jgi:hypothetical protein